MTRWVNLPLIQILNSGWKHHKWESCGYVESEFLEMWWDIMVLQVFRNLTLDLENDLMIGDTDLYISQKDESWSYRNRWNFREKE